jgi:type IV pilus assembly protein PilO
VNAKLKDPKFAIGGAVAVGLLVAVAGWMMLVSPAKSKASKLETQVQSTQAEIATRRAAIASKPKIRVDVRSSDLYRLTKAVPGQQDMSGIVLELNRVAKSAGVNFDSITPSQPVQAQGYRVHPLAVVVSGRFGEVNGFLHSVRKLVTVRKGKLDARGRLFAIDTVSVIEEPDKHFPTVQATVTLDAFVYAGGSGPGTPGTTTPSTDTSSPSGAVAAGATS